MQLPLDDPGSTRYEPTDLGLDLIQIAFQAAHILEFALLISLVNKRPARAS